MTKARQFIFTLFVVNLFLSKMKTIGLIGGLSWQSTQTYYNVINTEVKNKILSEQNTTDAFLRAQLIKLDQTI